MEDLTFAPHYYVHGLVSEFVAFYRKSIFEIPHILFNSSIIQNSLVYIFQQRRKSSFRTKFNISEALSNFLLFAKLWNRAFVTEVIAY
jgi:hypothetical protein